MKDLTAVSFVCLVFLPAPGGAGPKDLPASAAALTAEHWNTSKSLSLRTPAGWVVQAGTGQPELTEARGDGLIVRVLRREGELGLDSLHVECMLVRLAGPMDTFPQ